MRIQKVSAEMIEYRAYHNTIIDNKMFLLIITAEYQVNRLIYNYQEETNYLREYINS